ncbi:NAD(P)/FAD-dependent oxidoreductase [Bacteroidota bacterium]
MIYFVYSIELSINKELNVLKNRIAKKNIKLHRIEIKKPYIYEIPKIDICRTDKKPIIVGTGPCGLFAALILAKAGMKPLLIERGGDIDSRIKDVETFLLTGKLNINSNIQFGEGGAGTFSDGKLNTLITNPRIKYIFDEFVKAGAPNSILSDAQPHIGTDRIRNVSKNLRKKIIDLGGEVRYNTKLTDIIINNNKLTAIILDNKEEIKTNILVLAIGHSARDTYEMLLKRNIDIIQKPFSIGIRIEHKAEMINKAQYDKFYDNEKLGSAKYKLVAHSENNRSVYTFCMCPGGYVMPSSSEEGVVVTNGMSEYAQNSENSNSALLVNVVAEDFNSEHPLAGIEFQRKFERKAFELGGSNYYAPVQLVGDFLKKQKSEKIKSINPSYKPGVKLVSLDDCLPEFFTTSLREALPKLDNKIKGFAHPEAILTGIETRSSSPLRITRNQESMQSNIIGIYPAGEGSGYAGGIVSSAVDGMRVSESIINLMQ